MIEEISREGNYFRVRLFDDFSLVEFKVTKLRLNDEVLLKEMRVVDPDEARRVLEKVEVKITDALLQLGNEKSRLKFRQGKVYDALESLNTSVN